MSMLAGAGVTLYTNLQLASVTLSNLNITQMAMANSSMKSWDRKDTPWRIPKRSVRRS